jgi:hypothetical protein
MAKFHFPTSATLPAHENKRGAQQSMTHDVTPYVVQTGDNLDRIGFVHGVDPSEIWSHDANNDLRARRKNRAQLCAGDVLYIPMRTKERHSVTAHTANRYKARVPKAPIVLQFRDRRGPLRNLQAHVLGIPGTNEESPMVVCTTADGSLQLDIPVIVREIEVGFPSLNAVYHVAIGELDPNDELTGNTQRLRNLGYLSLDPEAQDERLTVGAITAFQRDHGLEATGQIDDRTREKLASEHRS